MTTKSWLPAYAGPRVSRRGFLRTTGAGTAAAVILACGGGKGGGGALKTDESGTSRQPGTVWFAKNDWKLADETKQAVRGGIYRGVTDADQTGHFDAITLMISQVPVEYHVHELLMAKNRGAGVDPASPAASTPVGSLAESWEFSGDGSAVTFNMRQDSPRRIKLDLLIG